MSGHVHAVPTQAPKASDVQCKGRVSQPGDPCEMEADRFADLAVQRKESNSSGGMPSPTRGGTGVSAHGSGLPLSVRAPLEASLGYDLSHVRVHHDENAAKAAEGYQAHAFAKGSDIYFNRGAYQPATTDGYRLIAHEVVHTLQQGRSANEVRRSGWRDWAKRAWNDPVGTAEEAWEETEGMRETASEYGEKATEWASEKGTELAEGAEDWWNEGSGDIALIEFDGSEVRVYGPSTITVPAISGLLPNHSKAKGVDYTKPEHQHLPDVGPIPEGSYYIEPSEVETSKGSGFSPAAWGYYRVRLHEKAFTALYRRIATERTGGFYLHQDANSNGTAGCIGIVKASDNKSILTAIKKNSARIPVTVDYPDPVEVEEEPVQRMPLPGAENLAGSVSASLLGDAPILREDKTPPKPHWLVQAGIDKVLEDETVYGAGNFPDDYYDTLARYLFEEALKSTGDYGDAFSLIDDLEWGNLGPQLGRQYTASVGTDSKNGWDKVRHFIFTAYLQYKTGGFLAPEIFTYGKELMDELESWVGKDPEGYSVPDIAADNRGEAFGEEMRVREKAEIAAKNAQEWHKFKKVFIEQDPQAVYWFITNFR